LILPWREPCWRASPNVALAPLVAPRTFGYASPMKRIAVFFPITLFFAGAAHAGGAPGVPGAFPQQRIVVNPKTGEALIPSGPNYVGARSGTVFIPAGPNGVINPRNGHFSPVQ
jgi:hypothetical protein